MSKDDLKSKLLAIIKRACDSDASLREKFGVKDKFKFVRDKLSAISSSVEERLADVVDYTQIAKETLADDEVYVYVHLVNTQGLELQTWQKMVHPSVFHEYSVNRPIYASKEGIEALIRSKDNKHLHGFLTFRVKKAELLAQDASKKDASGNDLAKVKEGALKYERCIGFTHDNKNYLISDEGKLTLRE